MVEFLPFLLILVGWDASAKSDSMVVYHALHPSEQVCREKGEAFVARRGEFESPQAKSEFRYFCIPAPTASEYEAVLEQVK